MLKKINRLTNQKDFDKVYKNGKSSFDKIIGVKAVNNNRNNTRIGVVVSSKINKKAVVRNKIKRQIRSVIEKNSEKLKLGKDIVIIALPPIIEVEFSIIKISIAKHFKKLNLSN